MNWSLFRVVMPAIPLDPAQTTSFKIGFPHFLLPVELLAPEACLASRSSSSKAHHPNMGLIDDFLLLRISSGEMRRSKFSHHATFAPCLVIPCFSKMAMASLRERTT